MKQKGLPDVFLGLPPGLAKKSNWPKELVSGATRPGLLTLAKPLDTPAVNNAIKSPPGFSTKSLAHPPSSLLLKKAPLALTGSHTPKNNEDKSPQLSLSPWPASPRSEDEGPLNLTLHSDGGRELDCQLCGAWFETHKGLSSHACAHLRHLGVSDPDAKGPPSKCSTGSAGGTASRSASHTGAEPWPSWGGLLPCLRPSPCSPPTAGQEGQAEGVGTASPWGK